MENRFSDHGNQYQTFRYLSEHFRIDHPQLSETVHRCDELLDRLNEVLWELSDFTSYLHGKNFSPLEKDLIDETIRHFNQYINEFSGGISATKLARTDNR